MFCKNKLMFVLFNKFKCALSKKYIFLIAFCLLFSNLQAQNAVSLKQHLDTISTSDSNYEKTLNSYIKLSKQEKNSELLFDGYLQAIQWYSDSLIQKAYSDSAFVLVNKLNEKVYKVKLYQTLGHINFIDKNYPNSLNYELKGLELLAKMDNPYLYNKALYSVGATKLYMANYTEALHYFEKTSAYFSSKTDLSHTKGYLNSIRSEAICNYYLNNLTKARELLTLGRQSFYLLNEADRIQEQSYFDLTQGMVSYSEQNYQQSLQLLTGSLPEVVLNEDFANEYLIYFYLGKNYWELNNQELALTYFKKIDDLFTNKEYINVHFLKAYNYLIEYYHQENDLKKQLFYTNQLLNATQNFQQTQSHLVDSFHKEFDTKLLVVEKEKLEGQIAKKHLILVLISFVGVLVLVFFVIFYIRNKRKEKEYQKRYKEVLQQIADRKVQTENSKALLNEKWVPLINPHWNSYLHSDTTNSTAVLNDKKDSLPNVLIDELNAKLICFEDNKLYLKADVTLNDLAEYCKTNRSYLSQYINQVKQKSFPDYINSLRIHLLLDDLHTDSQLKRYKTEVIAEKYGYTNRRSFANAFLKHTGISYSYYVDQLKSNNSSYSS